MKDSGIHKPVLIAIYCLNLVGCGKHIATLVSQIETRKREFSQSTKFNSNNNNNNNTIDNNGMNEIEDFLSNYNPPSSLAEWLESIKCSQYLDFFMQQGFEDVKDIRMIDQSLFDQFPDAIKFAHQKYILKAVNEYTKFQDIIKRIESGDTLLNNNNNNNISNSSSQQHYHNHSQNNESYDLEVLSESSSPISPIENNHKKNKYNNNNNNNNNNNMEVVEQYQDVYIDFNEPNVTNFNSDGKWPYIADSILKQRVELDVYNRSIRETLETNRIKTIEFDRASLKGVVFGHVEIELMQHRPEYKVEIEFSDYKSVILANCNNIDNGDDNDVSVTGGSSSSKKSRGGRRSYNKKRDDDSDFIVDNDYDYDDDDDNDFEEDYPKKRKRKSTTKNGSATPKTPGSGKKPYYPTFRSGAWAFMMALYVSTMRDDQPELKKPDILSFCTIYTDNKNIENSWSSSMKTLETNELVMRTSNSAYKLTPKGLQLGKKIYKSNEGEDLSPTQEGNGSPVDIHVLALDCIDGGGDNGNNNDSYLSTNNDLLNNSYDNPEADLYQLKDWSDSDDDVINYMLHNSPLTKEEMLKIRANSLVINSVQLLVDNREVKKGRDNSNLLQGLSRRNISFDLRTLPLGDFLWVAKAYCADDPQKSMFEVVLNLVIERKRLTDLKESSTDGRYADQKYRLARCGITKVFYLVEGDNTEMIIKDTFYEQCIAETSIYDRFQPMLTSGEEGTVLMLDNLHKMFERGAHQYLTDMTFADFEERSEHVPISIGGIFAQTLLSINGMTQTKATAILRRYPTQKSLYDAYYNLRFAEEAQSANLLALLCSTDSPNVSVGYQLSQFIYKLYKNVE
ncbi:hypothetical protein PPL_00156 [Heterostelium album PN500]|uniref:Crossover junction endonuclease MUS81 n=1 Tax=Heterostelium pallidum (strain ATCC 26659 / Pp 5 / PN500) TaxID=670386 RepID=D3AVP1_HETP5|nr:hypothetical protein PPL_00156 [Heterostelium album PN500]EFA86364.1 hypothetical protein PPL_00156 [Heterostelium album PN500]|eukprot:XP_020438469.1 hypothetical protein PPL_00156 [Heterostelium album PN500]